MKTRIIAFLLILIVSAVSFTGCGTSLPPMADNGKVNIVCTTFAVYDWINEIVGDNSQSFEVNLLSGGGDIHSYQPSAADIAKIHTSDLLVYIGGQSDVWVEKLLDGESKNVLRLFDVNKEMLLVTDMHQHSHEHSHEHSHSGEEYDEHIWLSLKIAERSVEAICDAVVLLDTENADRYRENANNYCEKLALLNEEYKAAVENSADKTVIFADRFPFAYMLKDYGIEYIAAFPGCSSDTNAGFETVIKLAEEMNRLQKKTVLVLENSNQTIADAVISAAAVADARPAVMDSCQAIGGKMAQKADYLNIMKENLKALKMALD